MKLENAEGIFSNSLAFHLEIYHFTSSLSKTESKPKTEGHSFSSIFFSNARSMVNKLDAIHGTIKANSFSIAAITESWLSSCVTDDLISLPGYVTCRKDRPDDKRSGGICT